MQIEIPDSGKGAVPVAELHFYQWLQEHPSDNRMHAVREYLESLGRVRGSDFVTLDDLDILKATFEIWRRLNHETL